MLRNLLERLPGRARRDGGAPVRHVLIASEGRRVSDEVIARAAGLLAAEGGASRC